MRKVDSNSKDECFGCGMKPYGQCNKCGVWSCAICFDDHVEEQHGIHLLYRGKKK